MDDSPAKHQPVRRRRWLLWAVIGLILVTPGVVWVKSSESVILGRASRLQLGQTREQTYSVMGLIKASGGPEEVSWDSQANQRIRGWQLWFYEHARLKKLGFRRPRHRREDELVYVHFDANGLADYIKRGSETVKRPSQPGSRPPGSN